MNAEADSAPWRADGRKQEFEWDCGGELAIKHKSVLWHHTRLPPLLRKRSSSQSFTTSTRSVAPTFRNMLCTWFFTVCSDKFSCVAISLFVRRSRKSSTICCSRRLSPKSEPQIKGAHAGWETTRNSAINRDRGQTASPAATARMVAATSTAEASFNT